MATTTDKDYILSNQAQCLECGDRPYSRTVHDCSGCKCGNMYVDGGQHYARRGWRAGPAEQAFKDLTITWPKVEYDRVVADVKTVFDDENTDPWDWARIYASARALPLEMIPALAEAGEWCVENRRNPHGVVCAMARAERDGEWLG